jgi:hypothetical protein
MMMHYITMTQRVWSERHAEWCFMGFSEEDDHVTYVEPPGAPEVLPSWTEPANMASLEAAIERIQKLRNLGLTAQYVVNSALCLCSDVPVHSRH